MRSEALCRATSGRSAPRGPGARDLAARVLSALVRLGYAGLLAAAVSGCSSTPPESPDDLCAVFREKPGWYRDARSAERSWGIPIHVTMAFVHRESSYVADARPPRNRLLWIIPWRRPSSAYGYAQATSEAWKDYRKATNRLLPDRADFDDAVDFIGWYNHRSARSLNIPKDDAYRLYLAYHEGPTGYRRGQWRNKPNVRSYAQKVERRAARYRTQLAGCRDELDAGPWWWPF